MLDEYNLTDKPIFCKSCATSFPVSFFSASDYERLQNLHVRQKFAHELEKLLLVQDLYQRYPEVEGIASANFHKRLFGGIAPGYEPTFLSAISDQDREILEYLRNRSFSLLPRLQYVSEQLSKYEQPLPKVLCSICKTGELKIDAETWVNPVCFYD